MPFWTKNSRFRYIYCLFLTFACPNMRLRNPNFNFSSDTKFFRISKIAAVKFLQYPIAPIWSTNINEHARGHGTDVRTLPTKKKKLAHMDHTKDPKCKKTFIYAVKTKKTPAKVAPKRQKALYMKQIRTLFEPQVTKIFWWRLRRQRRKFF